MSMQFYTVRSSTWLYARRVVPPVPMWDDVSVTVSRRKLNPAVESNVMVSVESTKLEKRRRSPFSGPCVGDGLSDSLPTGVKCLMVPMSRVGPRLTSSVHPAHVTRPLLCDGRIITTSVRRDGVYSYIHTYRAKGSWTNVQRSSIQKQVERWRQPLPVPCQEYHVSRT